MAKDMNMQEMGMNGHGGLLYMQTNEIKNAIIHYHRSASGRLTEVVRVSTCGTIAGLNDQTGIARREVDRRGRQDIAAEKLRGFRFSFCFNHQRIDMADAQAKLISGDRS